MPTPVFPGRLVDEIGKLPLAIDRVGSGIPAFIGHTQIASRQSADDLRLVPTRITSMSDYQLLFGLPQPETGISVTIGDAAASVRVAARSPHSLAYAVQLFFANGGNACWIVSVGGYRPAGGTLVAAKLAAGLTSLVDVTEPDLIVIPEAASLGLTDYRQVMDAALGHCAANRCFLILDAHGGDQSLANPATSIATAIGNFRDLGIGTANLQYGAAYAPHLVTEVALAIDPATTLVTRVTGGIAAPAIALAQLPEPAAAIALAAIAARGSIQSPAGAIAGVFAATDNMRGVWKAPANVALASVRQPAIAIDNAIQDGLNIDPVAGKSVNAIRTFAGRGTLVWGARTLAGNDNEFRYVSVRRLVSTLQRAISRGIQPLVFEANDAATWAQARQAIENHLHQYWRDGAFMGNRPEQAFFVHVGLGTSMTALDIAQGRMIVRIGIAPVRPAEFLLFTLTQAMLPADPP